MNRARAAMGVAVTVCGSLMGLIAPASADVPPAPELRGDPRDAGALTPSAWRQRFASAPTDLAMMNGDTEPELLLAQRSIDRSWGLSEDSTYVEVDIPGWRSEPLALALSAAAPGLGHAYVGSSRGWWFAVAEAAGWTARWLWTRRGDDLQDDAVQYAGTPNDTTSRWTFTRWTRNTGLDDAEIRALYDRDRDAFYDRIANDSRYLGGWEGDAPSTRSGFSELMTKADDRLRYARHASSGLWINHVVAGIDALRAARAHNMPLAPKMNFGWRTSLHRGHPQLAFTVTRSF